MIPDLITIPSLICGFLNTLFLSVYLAQRSSIISFPEATHEVMSTYLNVKMYCSTLKKNAMQTMPNKYFVMDRKLPLIRWSLVIL